MLPFCFSPSLYVHTYVKRNNFSMAPLAPFSKIHITCDFLESLVRALLGNQGISRSQLDISSQGHRFVPFDNTKRSLIFSLLYLWGVFFIAYILYLCQCIIIILRSFCLPISIDIPLSSPSLVPALSPWCVLGKSPALRHLPGPQVLHRL
jgi:hypothetical protein